MARILSPELQLKQLIAKHTSRQEKAEMLIYAVRSSNFEGIIDTVKYAKGIKAITEKKLHITPYTAAEAGKMLGIPALGTTCHVCNSCQKNIEAAIAAKDLNCPCLHCYSSLGTVYDFDVMHLIVNHDRLQEFISDSELQEIAKEAVKIATNPHTVDGVIYPASYSIRIQHKGDVDSVIEAVNYFKFAAIVKSINPLVSVTAYTKFPETYDKALKLFPDDCKLENMRIGYSCYKMGILGILEAQNIKTMYPFLSFSFIVYKHDDGRKEHTNEENEAYVLENFSELVTSAKCAACKCGKGSCGKCGICYHSPEYTVIFEECR